MAFIGSAVGLSAGAGALLGGGLIAGGSLASGLIGASAANKAADLQANAANNALAFQKQAFDTSQGQINSAKTNFQPYLDVGKGATYTLGQLTGAAGSKPDYSSFYNSPDYNFAQQQGELGIERGANARGLNLSGGTLRDLSSFNSGLATQQYGNYYNRLMGLSQLGANAAGGVGNLVSGQASNATNASNGIANTTMGVGQAQASGIVGGANAITGSLNSGIQNSLLANALGRSPSAYSSGSSGSGLPGSPNSPFYGPEAPR